MIIICIQRLIIRGKKIKRLNPKNTHDHLKDTQQHKISGWKTKNLKSNT